MNADDCVDISATINPSTASEYAINYTCIESCLDNANPEMNLISMDCGYSERAAVWFKIELDDLAEEIYIYAQAENWQPIWTLYQGDSCDNLTALNCMNNISPESSNTDITPYLSINNVIPNASTYYLIVSSDRVLSDQDNHAFELCISSTIKPIICSSFDNNSCVDSTQAFQLVDREFSGSLDGPFSPGEQVTICIDYLYDSTNSEADWMMALIPSFGSNWDVQSFEPESAGLTGEWFENGADCAPLIQENVNNLCTYVNADGILTLCNALCEVCPCELGMEEGDPLPSGWYWVTPGGNAECENDCTPGEGWGLGSTTFALNFCIELRINEAPDYNDPYGLQISLNALSDGVAGCWEDPVGECLNFKPALSPIWELEECMENALDDFTITEFLDCQGDGLVCSGELITILAGNFPDHASIFWELEDTNGQNIIVENSAILSQNIYLEGEVDLTVSAHFNCQSLSVDTTFIVEAPGQLDTVYLSQCSGELIGIDPIDYIGYEADFDPFEPIKSEVDTMFEILFISEDSCGCRSIQAVGLEVFVEQQVFDTLYVDSEMFELVYQDTLLTSLGEHIIFDEDGGENGCGINYFVLVELSTSTQNLNQLSSKVYPNPTTNILFLQLENVRLKNIQLLNATGEQKLFEISNSQIDLSQLPTGIYFLVLEFRSGEKAFHKFIKL